jgi:outer membrane protein assembly factor BamB
VLVGALVAASLVFPSLTAVADSGTLHRVDGHTPHGSIEPDPLGYTSYQGGPTHVGFNASILGTHPTRAWTFRPHTQMSTPLVVGDRVFVSYGVPGTDPGQLDTSELVALSAATGRVLWGPVPLHRYARAATLAYLGNTLYTNSYGIIQGWNPVTGAVKWTTAYGVGASGEEAAQDPLTAGDGVLATYDPAQQAVKALDATTGALLWSTPDDYLTGMSTPSIGAGVVSIGQGCSAETFSLKTGTRLWQANGQGFCALSGANPSPIRDGTIFIGGEWQGLDVAAKSGQVVNGDDVPTTPSFAAGREFWIGKGALHGHRVDSERGDWTTSNAHLAGQPMIAGTTAVAGTASLDRVSGYNMNSGRRLWTVHPAVAPYNANDPLPSPALVVGDGMLLVDTGSTITAYDGSEGPPPSPLRPPPMPAPQIPDVASPPLGTSWTGVYGDARNDDDNAAENAGPPYTLAWTASIGRIATQPVIMPGGVFVLVLNATTPGTSLYGFNTATGAQLWPPVDVGGANPLGYLTESNGVLVAGDGFATAIGVAASTGTVLWRQDGNAPNGLPQAVNGELFRGVTVSDLFTGDEQAYLGSPTQPEYSGFDVVAGGHLYINGGCDGTYRYSGTHLDWASPAGCYGGSGTSAAYEQGALVGESEFGDLLFHSAATGRVLGSVGSTWLPTSAGDTLYLEAGMRIVAEHKLSNRIAWTFTMPAMTARPVEVTGHTLLAIDTRGDLVALNAVTGTEEWSTSISGTGETQWSSFGSPALAAAQGVVVIPTHTGITVLRGTGGITDPLPPIDPTPPLS